MRRTAVLSLLLALPLLLAGCRAGGRSEPEQIYLVSAVGFDPDSNGGVRLSLEVPLTRESADESPAPALFTGEGGTVEEALRQIAAGLGRRLLFSHCALLVLGVSALGSVVSWLRGYRALEKQETDGAKKRPAQAARAA